MWQLEFSDIGYEKFLTNKWLFELGTSDPGDPSLRWARLYVPLQAGVVKEGEHILYTFQQVS